MEITFITLKEELIDFVKLKLNKFSVMSVKTVYTCTRCDAQSPKWQGRCSECGAWGTLTLGAKEEKTATLKPTVAPAEVVRLADVSTDENFRRLPTGTSEIDRVFGGGIVTGSLTLLSGEPGIGKSTLVAQIADALAKKHKIIYTSGEESLGQVKLRLERLGCDLKNFNFINSTDVEKILSAVEIQSADLVIIDSIQTVQTPLVPQEAGSLNQIRAIAVRCLEVAKRRNIAFILIGHVTKDGNIAGPKSLEHLVDTVLYLEQETARGYQLLRASKNRFGSTNELGVFEMTNTGFKPIANPSSIFLEETESAGGGSATSCIMEGTRPFLVEVQALVTKTVFGYPQRKTSGFDLNRLQVLAAVLNKRTKFNLITQDIILNLVGGLRVTDPGLDLAVSAAIISSFLDKSLPRNLLILGEVGLGGEIRPVAHLNLRIKEASKLGFKKIITPRLEQAVKGLEITTVKNLDEAISAFWS
jgi:DNA repair protein RadA/Sms